jgi:hypothetical protein
MDDDRYETFDPAQPPRFLSPRCAALLRYWNQVRGTRTFPARGDIDPEALKPLLPHIMMLTVEYEPFRVCYRLVGTEIVRFAKFDFTGRYADALNFQDDAAVDWTGYYRKSVAARQPGHGVTYWSVAGSLRRWIEFLVCPLSSDGTVIDRFISIEDYEHLNMVEIDTLRPVAEQ